MIRGQDAKLIPALAKLCFTCGTHRLASSFRRRNLVAIVHPAPSWHISRWFNSAPLTLADLRGRVLVVHAFQMLCPGCAMQALPQMNRLHQMFPTDRLAVIGLHTVFEHHEAQGPLALEAFLHEYRYTFPVGVDEYATDNPLPRTMRAYAMQGTPTLILIDAQGRLREQHFGVLDDIALGVAVGSLMSEADRPDELA